MFGFVLLVAMRMLVFMLVVMNRMLSKMKHGTHKAQCVKGHKEQERNDGGTDKSHSSTVYRARPQDIRNSQKKPQVKITYRYWPAAQDPN